MTPPGDSHARVVLRRRWAWWVALVALAAATAFCGWGAVDEWGYSRDVAEHYGRATGTVVRDGASPSGLAVDWEDRYGQARHYRVDRSERSDLELRAGDRTDIRYNDDTGDEFLQDEDGPMPWLPTVLAVAAAALLVLVWRRGRRWVHSVGALPEQVALLRTLPGAKAAYLHLTPAGLDLVLPRYFGARPWTVPADEVAVLRTDLSEPAQFDGEDGVGPVFARPVVVPYLPTGVVTASPNLLLLFARPVQFPMLKRHFALPGSTRDLPFSYRDIERGATVDGLELRADDPADAERYLREHGIAAVDDPDAWLAAHRELVHDEERRAALIARDEQVSRWGRRVSWVTGASVAVLIAARIFGNEDSNTWLAVIAVAAATTFLVPFAVGRLLRRTDPDR